MVLSNFTPGCHQLHWGQPWGRSLEDPSWPLLYALLIPIFHVRVSNMAKCFPIICTMFVP